MVFRAKRNELSSHKKISRRLKCKFQSESTNLKGLYNMGFQLYDMLGKARLWRQRVSGCQQLAGRDAVRTQRIF